MKTMTKQLKQTSVIGIVLFCAGLMGNLFAADDYTTWSHSLNLVLNTTSTGANVTSTVTNFPVLVRLNSSNFANFSQTATGGTDIRFSKVNGAHLRYQIERWDVTNQVAEVWVLVDTVFGNNRSQKIKMYWGNGSAADSSNGAAVFDTANGFVSAYHMNALAGNVADATANSLTANAVGSPTYQQTGDIGNAIKLSGNGQNFDAGNSSLFNMSANKKITVSAWVNRAGASPSPTLEEGIVVKSKWNNGNNYREFTLYNNNSGTNGFAFNVSSDGTSTNETVLLSNTPPTNGTWYYVTGMMDASNMYIFVNGVQKNSVAKTAIYSSTNSTLKIGLIDTNGTILQYWNGTLDEVRVEKVARSADWIKLCYQNQQPSQNLVEIEDYSQWAYSKNIHLNTTSTGSNVASNQYKFPVLLRLTSSNFVFGQAMTNGEDLRFSKTNGDILSYEIERWDATNQVAEVWVKLDTVFGNNSAQYFNMYWGKTGSVSKSNSTAVFDTGNGFAAAYHLKESSGAAADATINALNGARNGNAAATAGIIGQGQTFDGSGDYFQTGAFDKGNFGAAFTMSGWVNVPGSVAGPGGMWSKGNADGTWAANRVQFFLGNDSTGSAQAGRYPEMVSYGRNWIIGNTAITPDTWHYLVYQYNPTGPARAIYVDGVLQTLSYSSFGGTDNTGDIFFIGRRISTDVNTDFNGKMDEVVMSQTNRSADWIKLCYESQKIGATLVILDPPPFGLTYSQNPASYSTGSPILNNTPTLASGTSNLYTVTPALPAGLTLDSIKGIISGTPTVQQASAAYTITAKNASGSTTVSLAITITAPVAPSGLTYSVNPATYIAGSSITANNPSLAGGSASSFTISPALPAGFIWNSSTGVISGTPTAALAQTAYTVTASNASGSTNATLTITVTCSAIATQVHDTLVNDTSTTVKVPVSFTFATTGGNIKYLWQDSGAATVGAWATAVGKSCSTSTYYDTVQWTDNGTKFRCNATTACGIITSNTATLSICYLPHVRNDIGQQPVSRSSAETKPDTFSIKPAAWITNPAYQWSRTTGTGTSWADITGATSPTYIFNPVYGDSASKLRCKLSSTCGVASVTSDTVTLTVWKLPTVTTQPVAQSVNQGATATFSVVAGPGFVPSYQWQFSSNSGTTYSNVSTTTGGITASYSITADTSKNGYLYRCVVMDTVHKDTVNSSSALLSVCYPAAISTQSPTGPITVTLGDTAKFSVAALGNGTITYQWQDSIAGVWYNCAAGTGATSPSYSFKADSAGFNGRTFHCQVTGCGSSSKITTPVLLTICTPPSFTSQPQSIAKTPVGVLDSFVVTGAGSPNLYYQWQNSLDGITWKDTAGLTSPKISFTTAANQNGVKYRCKLTSSSACGTTPAYSSACTVSVCTPPSIATQPTQFPAGTQVTNAVACSVVVAAATSAPISYQWQRSPISATNWIDDTTTSRGAKTYKYSIASVLPTDTGEQYHCVISNGCGASAISNSVSLSGCIPKSITVQPVSDTVTVPTAAVFAVTASGSGALSYEWQDSSAAHTWQPVSTLGTTASYSIATTQANEYVDGLYYRCRVYNGNCGSDVYSKTVKLTICTPPSSFATQPVSQNLQVNTPAAFSVTLKNGVSNPAYQWQWDSAGIGVWKNFNVSTATTPTCSVVVTNALNNTRFKCNVTNLCGSLASNICTLSVCGVPSLTALQNLTATNNLPASFSVTGTGTSLSYKWYYSSDAGSHWTVAPGVDTLSTYSFTPSLDSSFYQHSLLYHCVATSSCGATKTSNDATLTICDPAKVIVSPIGPDVNHGDKATFNMTAKGTSVTYQWQRYGGLANDTTKGWVNCDTSKGAVGATSSSYSFNTDTSILNKDNNARFRCKIQNGCGQDSTTIATLLVCANPVVITQPVFPAVPVLTGTVCSTFVNCAGVTITYQWQRSTDSLQWTSAPDTNYSKKQVYKITTKSSDNNTWYRCYINSRCGYIYSAAAKLAVCTPVSIDTTIPAAAKIKSVLVGDTVTYHVAISGSAPKIYWKRKAVADTGFIVIDSNKTTLSFIAKSADSASKYRCVVSGQCGATVDSASLFVFVPLRAVFGVNMVSGQAPLSVVFTDSSVGSYTSHVWDFGDGTTDATTLNPSHRYTDTTVSRTYTATLTISGPAPRVASTTSLSISTWPAGGNPIGLTGAYVASTKVKVVISNYNAVTPPSAQVTPVSLLLWRKVGAIPSSSTDTTVKLLSQYTFTKLKATGSSSYTDTMSVPVLSGSDSTYGIISSIVWSDSTRSVFSKAVGFSILMKDTMPIINSLQISGVYVPDTTADISLGSLKLIDTTRVDSALVWYSLTSSTPDFANKSAVKGFKVTGIYNGNDTAGKYHIYITNGQFNNILDTLYAAVILIGKNKRTSNIQQSPIIVVGKQRPSNPITLAAKVLSSSRIQLSWNNLVQTGMGLEKMMIWYKTGIPLSLQADSTYGYALSGKGLDSLTPAIGDTVIVGNSFSGKTRYYFYAQVYKNTLWSTVPLNAAASCSTWAAGAPLDSNSLEITKMVFDSTVNQIKVSWKIDAASQVDTNLQVGILYSTSAFPLTNTNTQQIIKVTASPDSAYIKLVTGDALKFDSTYYVTLWLRRTDGDWTSPTLAAYAKLTLPHFTWQAISFNAKAVDTVYAFNKTIQLRNQTGDITLPSNIVYFRTADSLTLQNFIPVSTAFGFTSKTVLTQFWVGLKIDSIPTGHSISDIRIYRKINGMWSLSTDSMRVDSVNGYISILTNQQLDQTFAAMIDFKPPVVTITSGDTLGAVQSGVAFSDTVVVHDNISNVKWWFQTAKGGDAFVLIDSSSVLSDTTGTLSLVIPSGNVSKDNGVKVRFICSDGIHYDTIDLSRSVSLGVAGVVNIDAQKWTPLGTSMDIVLQDAGAMIRSISADSANWKYDKKTLRLFRWYSYAGNATAAANNKWVEYSDTTKSLFMLNRGTQMWIKSKTKTAITLGAGATPSLKFAYTLSVPPGTWADFVSPYNFDIKINDILTATKAASGTGADSLIFNAWQKDGNGIYQPEPLYMTGSTFNSDSSTLASPLDSMGMNGFVVYNPYSTAINIKIPPLSKAMSVASVSKKSVKSAKPAVTGWAIKIVTKLADSSTAPSVYCGFTNSQNTGIGYYPCPPSFGSVRAGVFDIGAKKLYGHAFAHATVEGGNAYIIAFTNETDQPAKLQYHIVPCTVIPQGLVAGVFNATTQKFEETANTGVIVTVGANSTAYRWLFVGSKEYLAKASIIAPEMKLMFAGTYPNPFRSQVRIRYSLPYTGVEKVHFAIYDLLGRSIWQHEISSASQYGKNEIVWNAKTNEGRSIAAGLYIIRMTAINEKQKAVGIFDRKMTYMP